MHSTPPAIDDRFSWANAVASPWNQRIIQKLVNEFMDNVSSGLFTALPQLPTVATPEWIFDDIADKLQRQARTIKAAAPRLLVNETDTERDRRIAEFAARKLIRARRYQRKKSVRFFCFCLLAAH
jgi:hypothetical protein